MPEDTYCTSEGRPRIHYVLGYPDGSTRSVTYGYGGCHLLELEAPGRFPTAGTVAKQDAAPFMEAVADGLLAQRRAGQPPEGVPAAPRCVPNTRDVTTLPIADLELATAALCVLDGDRWRRAVVPPDLVTRLSGEYAVTSTDPAECTTPFTGKVVGWSTWGDPVELQLWTECAMAGPPWAPEPVSWTLSSGLADDLSSLPLGTPGGAAMRRAALGLAMVLLLAGCGSGGAESVSSARVPAGLEAGCPDPTAELRLPGGDLPRGATRVRLCPGPSFVDNHGSPVAPDIQGPVDMLTADVDELVALVNEQDDLDGELLCNSDAGPELVYWFGYPGGDWRAVQHGSYGCDVVRVGARARRLGGVELSLAFTEALLAQRPSAEPPVGVPAARCLAPYETPRIGPRECGPRPRLRHLVRVPATRHRPERPPASRAAGAGRRRALAGRQRAQPVALHHGWQPVDRGRDPVGRPGRLGDRRLRPALPVARGVGAALRAPVPLARARRRLRRAAARTVGAAGMR